MNQSKVKRALRKKINHLPENLQEKIKDLLYQASIQDAKLFENLVNKLALKKADIIQKNEAYKVFQSSPEYNIPYVWTRKTPRKES